MPGCLLSGSILSQARRGSVRAELRCLAAGQPSRPISVEAPLWSQVVGSAYREDQQRSVSPLRSPPFCIRCLFFSLFSALSPFGITSLPPRVFPLKSTYFHLNLIIVIPLLSHFPHAESLPRHKQTYCVCFPPNKPLSPQKGSSTLLCLRIGIN